MELSQSEIYFFCRRKISENDPLLVIHWLAEALDQCLLAVHGQQIPDLPPIPAFLNVENPE
jgi:hypothetical protein